MRPTIYTYGIIGSLLAMATGFTGCDSVLGDDIPTEPENIIQLNTTTRSLESTSNDTETAIPGTVFLWTTEQEFRGTPYYISNIADLNANTKYNTGKPYPADGSNVYATGYSPVTDINCSSDRKTLTTTKGGEIDVCAAKTITGSINATFDERTPLVFEHTLTKVTFKALREITMEGNWVAGNIKVTIPDKYLPATWKWESDTYKVQNDTRGENLSYIYGHSLTNVDEAYEIGVAYLNLNNVTNKTILTDLTLDAELRRPQASETEVQKKHWVLAGIQLNNEKGNPVRDVLPGEAYQVIFRFSNDSFTLEARKQPWTNGGIITIPIDPEGGSNKK